MVGVVDGVSEGVQRAECVAQPFGYAWIVGPRLPTADPGRHSYDGAVPGRQVATGNRTQAQRCVDPARYGDVPELDLDADPAFVAAGEQFLHRVRLEGLVEIQPPHLPVAAARDRCEPAWSTREPELRAEPGKRVVVRLEHPHDSPTGRLRFGPAGTRW